MNVYFDAVYWLNSTLVRGLFVSVLVVILFHLVLKDKVNTQRASKIICWIILLYGIAALISQIIMLIVPPSEEYRIWERATGPYWWAYWIMIISHSVLPIVLLLIKSSRTIYFLLSLSIIMNAGWLFESFVLHMINFHRDYMPEKVDYNLFVPFPREQIIMLNGFLVGIVILIAANIDGIIANVKLRLTQK